MQIINYTGVIKLFIMLALYVYFFCLICILSRAQVRDFFDLNTSTFLNIGQKNAPLNGGAWLLFLLLVLVGFSCHLRQEVIAFLQIGRGIFPKLFRHIRLLCIKATETLLVEQRVGERI